MKINQQVWVKIFRWIYEMWKCCLCLIHTVDFKIKDFILRLSGKLSNSIIEMALSLDFFKMFFQLELSLGLSFYLERNKYIFRNRYFKTQVFHVAVQSHTFSLLKFSFSSCVRSWPSSIPSECIIRDNLSQVSHFENL